MTGAGMKEFFEAVDEKAQEFERDYKPELERRKKQRAEKEEESRQKELGKLMKDMAMSGEGAPKVAKRPPPPNDDMDTLSDLEDEDDEDETVEDGHDEDEAGLEDRYKQALAASGQADPEDVSWARYIRESKVDVAFCGD